MPSNMPLHCCVCGTELPLRAPQGKEAGQEWRCIGCGEIYFAAVLDTDSAPLTRGNVVQCDELPAAASRANRT